MLRDLVRSWWLLNVRGVFAVLFGAFVLFLAGTMDGFFTTAIAMVGVMFIFVFYLMASGALSIAATFRSFGMQERFWASLIHGTILIALGSWLFFSKQMALTWLVSLTVANALGSGLLEMILAHTMRRHFDSILLTVAGGVSLGTAMLLVLERNSHMSLLVSVLGVYAMFYGIVLFTFSLRLHGALRQTRAAKRETTISSSSTFV